MLNQFKGGSTLGFVSMFLLAACGGGNNSTSAQAPVSDVTISIPLQAANQAYIAAGDSHSFDVSGMCHGTATITDSAPVAATFEGANALVITTVVKVDVTDCTPTSFTSTEQDFLDANYNLLGTTLDDGSYGKLLIAATPLPASAKTGDTAVYGTQTNYTDNTKQTSTGTTVFSYLIEPDTGSSAIVNFISKIYDTSNQLKQTEQHRYRVTTDGKVTPVSIDIRDATGDVIFTAK